MNKSIDQKSLQKLQFIYLYHQFTGIMPWFTRSMWAALALRDVVESLHEDYVRRLELKTISSLGKSMPIFLLAEELFDCAKSRLSIQKLSQSLAIYLNVQREVLILRQEEFDIEKGHEILEIQEHILQSQYTALEDTTGQERIASLLCLLMIDSAKKHWKQLHERVVSLSPHLISSVKTISFEYMRLIRDHTDVLDSVSWEAFERIVAEVMASHGFKVDLTGRLKNRSADIIAIRSDELGVETKYLIECKRYRKDRRIGVDVVNQVIGSARRANADHAILVTSSEFTRDVVKQEAELRDRRLHLRDGQAVAEWLREYKPRKDMGLWLPEGWDMDQDK